MLNKLKEIAQGYYSLFFIKADKTTRRRLSICGKCKERKKMFNVCGRCGCFVPALCYCIYSKCDKWDEKDS